MKQEIFQRGPIACGISANENLDNFQGGKIYEDDSTDEINHIISIVG